MSDPASAAIAALSKALQEIPSKWTERQRGCRRFLRTDPLERVVPAKLLSEGLGKLLDERSPTGRPVVLFMDRAGGGDGARAAADTLPLLGGRWPGVSLIHVSFSTPAQGLGVLVRSILVQAGAEHGVNVQVVAHNRPAEGLDLDSNKADAITGECNLVITYAPGGAAGLKYSDRTTTDDPLLKRSHLAVLSYTDPESMVSELPFLSGVMDGEPTIDAIRLLVQIDVDGVFQDLGTARLGPNGDAHDRLWALIDNARRRRYRLLIEPMKNERPAGDPLVCPCRAVIEQDLAGTATVFRTVPAGSRLVTVAQGKSTLL